MNGDKNLIYGSKNDLDGANQKIIGDLNIVKGN